MLVRVNVGVDKSLVRAPRGSSMSGSCPHPKRGWVRDFQGGELVKGWKGGSRVVVGGVIWCSRDVVRDDRGCGGLICSVVVHGV